MLGQFQLAGRRVLSGQIVRPSVGVWHADVIVDGGEPMAGPAELVSQAGTSLRGTAEGHPEDGRTAVRLAGGGGGVGRVSRAQAFRGVPLRSILSDTLGGVGESLSPESDAGALASVVETYVRLARPAAMVLRYWAARLGMAWRVLPDGTTWLGRPERAPFEGPARVLARDGERRCLVVATEDLLLGPEHALEGLPIGCVIYTIRPDEMRAEAYYL